jgi:hypothetical protein
MTGEIKYCTAFFSAECAVVDFNEYRHTHPLTADRMANLFLNGVYSSAKIEELEQEILPGKSGPVNIQAILVLGRDKTIKPGVPFELREGSHTLARCKVTLLERVEL